MANDNSQMQARGADGRRSQRVLLRVPIQVRAEIKGEPPIHEDTTTLVVNAHGALILLAMKVRPGQKLVLRNWASTNEQECLVIHVRETQDARKEIGIAFPYAKPEFWGIDFPPADWKPPD